MKVLQVIDVLRQGGTERVAVDLAILLSKTKDVEVSFYCLLDPSQLDEELKNYDIDITYLHCKVVELVYLEFSDLMFIIFFVYVDIYARVKFGHTPMCKKMYIRMVIIHRQRNN